MSFWLTIFFVEILRRKGEEQGLADFIPAEYLSPPSCVSVNHRFSQLAPESYLSKTSKQAGSLQLNHEDSRIL